MLPLQEGIGAEKRVYGDAAAGPPLKRLRAGATLSDLQADYALFTYAPLFLFGGLEHNPIQEWINANEHKQIVFIFQVKKPILHIGAAPIWDQTLWAVEKEYWPALALHLGSLALIDREKKKLTKVICQDIPVMDVAARDSLVSVKPLLITITTFSVDSNLGCLAFSPISAVTKRPYLQFHPARDETVKLSNALLAFNDKPYQGIQNPPWEPNENSNTPAEAV